MIPPIADLYTRPPKLRHQLLLALIPWLILALAFLPQLVRADEPDRFEPAARGSRALSRAEVRELAAEYFPAGTADYATRIAVCESGLDPEATAPYGYRGLWQIDPDLHGWRAVRLFGPGASLWHPRVNAAVAAEILGEQGWNAWPVCSK